MRRQLQVPNDLHLLAGLSHAPAAGRLGLALLALAAGALVSLVAAPPALAQAIDTTLWVANGPVLAVVRSGSTIYVGGNFTQVGPAIGSGVPIDSASGVPLGIPRVAGTVNAVASDGVGGWYVGGSFTHVGGVPRSYLARILADHSLSSWNPNPNGTTASGWD